MATLPSTEFTERGCSGDHCCVKSLRLFLLRKKNVRQDIEAVGAHQGFVEPHADFVVRAGDLVLRPASLRDASLEGSILQESLQLFPHRLGGVVPQRHLKESQVVHGLGRGKL